jgi:hypothetical protein
VHRKIIAATKKSMSESNKYEDVDLFFYGKGILHHEFVPDGQTVKGQFCLEVMKCLREAERRKRPEEWKNKTWMLHNDSAPADASHLVREFLVKPETTVIPQLPYYPDYAPADFVCS